MSIGEAAQFFLAKSETGKAVKESYIPSANPLSNPNEHRERRNKLAKIQQRKG